VINRLLNLCKFNTEFIELVELNKIMIARGSHDIILFNLLNKFSIELTVIQYPLFPIFCGSKYSAIFSVNQFTLNLRLYMYTTLILD
jgi:hypothetical protein